MKRHAVDTGNPNAKKKKFTLHEAVNYILNDSEDDILNLEKD